MSTKAGCEEFDSIYSWRCVRVGRAEDEMNGRRKLLGRRWESRLIWLWRDI
jgi:hypothetical protein